MTSVTEAVGCDRARGRRRNSPSLSWRCGDHSPARHIRRCHPRTGKAGASRLRREFVSVRTPACDNYCQMAQDYGMAIETMNVALPDSMRS